MSNIDISTGLRVAGMQGWIQRIFFLTENLMKDLG
jgi:hypothetical protein